MSIKLYLSNDLLIITNSDLFGRCFMNVNCQGNSMNLSFSWELCKPLKTRKVENDSEVKPFLKYSFF